ncbi:hypothetical protein [Streptomyces sp. NPDC001250]|uniref:hypothetical protein n=1 Tax=unclassified Streptomyces TaxID=2593676 RepID=UPI00331A31D7
MDGEEHLCPVCGQPVEAVVRRHKTLGVWVPVWGPGPCRNPECRTFARPAGPTGPARPARQQAAGPRAKR